MITNRDLLVRVLRSPAFLAGELSTTFLDDHDLGPRSDPDSDVLHLAAAALCSARRRVRGRGVLATVPAGWRNNPSQPQQVAYDRGEVRYRFDGGGAWTVWTGGAEHRVTVLAWPDERADGAVDIEMDGRRVRVHVAEDAAGIFVDSLLGSLALRELPRHPPPDAVEPPGSLHAPMPGTVVAVPVEQGTAVRRGDVLVRLEAMKMEHVVAAPHDGSVVEVRVTPGTVVAAGDVLAVLEEG